MLSGLSGKLGLPPGDMDDFVNSYHCADLVIVDGMYELFDEEGNFGYRGFWSTVERIRDGISRIVYETAGEYKLE